MKKKKAIKLVLLIIVVSFLCFYSFSFAKYVSNSIKDYYLKSKGFYFYSDYLSTEVVKNSNNNWNNDSVHFNIRNNLNEKEVTDYDINYTASCEVLGDANEKVACLMNGSATNTFIGVLSSVESCRNYTGDLVDVSLLSKTDCELNGYIFERQVITKDLYFDLSKIDSNYEIKDLVISVTVTSTSPYSKTLKGEFYIHKTDSEEIVTSLIDKTDYQILSITNIGNINKCINLSFDSTKLQIDNIDSFSNYEYDSNNYAKKVNFNLQNNTSKNIIFYKKDKEATYSINDFTISTDCIIE